MAVTFSLSSGQAYDASEGRKLLSRLGRRDGNPALIVDRAYRDDVTQQLALDLGYETVVPPLRTWLRPWQYGRVSAAAKKCGQMVDMGADCG